MNADRIKPGAFRLRVAAAALTLALGWIYTPLTLASWEPDVCEMECCIAEGHCCCAARHAYVKGREPKLGDVSLTIETTAPNRCSAACAASGFSAKKNLLRAAHAQESFITLASIKPKLYQGPFLIDCQFAAQPSSPRAPPACDWYIA